MAGTNQALKENPKDQKLLKKFENWSKSFNGDWQSRRALFDHVDFGLKSKNEITKAMAKAVLDDWGEINKTTGLASYLSGKDEKTWRDFTKTYSSILNSHLAINKNIEVIQANAARINQATKDNQVESNNASVNQEGRLKAFFNPENKDEIADENQNEDFIQLKALYQKALKELESTNVDTRVVAQSALNHIQNNLIPFYQQYFNPLTHRVVADEDSETFKATIQAHSDIIDSTIQITASAGKLDPDKEMKKVVTRYGQELATIEQITNQAKAEENKQNDQNPGEDNASSNSENVKKKPTLMDVLWNNRSTKAKIIITVLAAAALVAAGMFLGPLALPALHVAALVLLHVALTIGPAFQFAFTGAHMLTALHATFGGLSTAVQGIGTGLAYLPYAAHIASGGLEAGANQIGVFGTFLVASAVKSVAGMSLTAKIGAGVVAGLGMGAALASSLPGKMASGIYHTPGKINELFKSKPTQPQDAVSKGTTVSPNAGALADSTKDGRNEKKQGTTIKGSGNT